MTTTLKAVALSAFLFATPPACTILGRPKIIDECGRVLQERCFLRCVEVVPAKEPCPPGVAKQPVTDPCKG